MRNAQVLKGAAFLIPFFASQLALAEPIQWSPSTGGNGHYYELVIVAAPITAEGYQA